MITEKELDVLISSVETFRIEKTVSTTNMDKFCEAICAFANDMPNSKLNGYLLIGITDDGKRSGLKVTDELLKKISSIRSDGNILPMPVMSVEVFSFDDGDVLVVEVTPSNLPPVRYRGRTFIRIGPRKDLATREEEEILTERRSYNFPTMDNTPCCQATLEDIDQDLFTKYYLPKAVDAGIVSKNNRSVKEWMISLRLYSKVYDCPTNAALLLFGTDPRRFMPGAYVQYVRWDGMDNASAIMNQRMFQGNLCEMLPQLDAFIDMAIVQKRPIPVSALREEIVCNYPKWALREILMNAIMHRDYNGNAPIKFYQYPDRIEIINHGGLYGKARPENFPTVNDYRNPAVAEGMQILGYVNMLNHGIPEVQRELEENGNGKAVFTIDRITVFEAKLMESGKWRCAVAQNSSADNEPSERQIGDKSAIKSKIGDKSAINREQVICEYISAHGAVSTRELCSLLNIKSSRMRDILKNLIDKKILVANGANRNRTYSINSLNGSDNSDE